MLSIDELKTVLDYDPESGLFRWKVRRGVVLPGTVAGNTNTSGHSQIRYKRKLYLAHRLAFAFMTGAWPESCVDHINGDRKDNRWSNLREATHLQNSHNRIAGGAIPFKGVSRKGIRFVAQITINKRKRHIGLFSTAELAHQAYCQVARELHGEFFREG